MRKCPENIFSFQLTLDELSDKKRKKEVKEGTPGGREQGKKEKENKYFLFL